MAVESCCGAARRRERANALRWLRLRTFLYAINALRHAATAFSIALLCYKGIVVSSGATACVVQEQVADVGTDCV